MGTFLHCGCCIKSYRMQTNIMYTIISGTNRVGSNTLKVAKEYKRQLQQKGVDAQLLSLEGDDLLTNAQRLQDIENKFVVPAQNLLFIAPEYNGSFPGVLKLLFDNGKSHKIWWNKKALITGVSTGRAGNLRGMDHLSGILNYLRITVHPSQLPISSVDKLLDGDGYFTDKNTVNAIAQQLDAFIKWSK